VNEGVDIFARMLFSCMRVEIQYWGEGRGMIYKDSLVEKFKKSWVKESSSHMKSGLLMILRRSAPVCQSMFEKTWLFSRIDLEEEDETGEIEETSPPKRKSGKDPKQRPQLASELPKHPERMMLVREM
jgi:hypothetical protein